MRFDPKWMAAPALLAISACASVDPISQSPDPSFGESVKYNTALQTVDPDPQYPADAAQPGDSAVLGAAAVERLRTDQTNARHNSGVSQARSSTLSTTEGEGSGAGPQ